MISAWWLLLIVPVAVFVGVVVGGFNRQAKRADALNEAVAALQAGIQQRTAKAYGIGLKRGWRQAYHIMHGGHYPWTWKRHMLGRASKATGDWADNHCVATHDGWHRAPVADYRRAEGVLKGCLGSESAEDAIRRQRDGQPPPEKWCNVQAHWCGHLVCHSQCMVGEGWGLAQPRAEGE